MLVHAHSTLLDIPLMGKWYGHYAYLHSCYIGDHMHYRGENAWEEENDATLESKSFHNEHKYEVHSYAIEALTTVVSSVQRY